LKRPYIASISGKGGVGKTTLTALLLKVLIESSISDTILVVDADPATNLPDVLGIKIAKTVGDVVEEFRKRIDEFTLSGFDKISLLNYWIMRDCLFESQFFDFIAMGRGEGEGCYCYVNSVLTTILTGLVKNYSVVLMDMEAGLEHLNRRVDRHVNTMIVVLDPSVMSIKTAERIINIAKEVKINPDKFYAVGNRLPQNLVSEVESYVKKLGYEYAGTIPDDDLILKYSMEGKPLLDLPKHSKAVESARIIARNIELID